MPVNPPFTVYRDQLTSLCHGIALWKPNPPRVIYDKVKIGDVGYVREGGFIRMFNVMLPWDHESNRRLGEPVHYESLSCGPFADILKDPLDIGEYYSPSVSAETNARNTQAITPDDEEGTTYKCRSRGALLSLPHGGHREDIIPKKAFEDYIRDHVVSWFTWTQDNKLGVERMEELILVSGCTLATSWAVAAFMSDTMDSEISLASRTLGDNGGASFIWRNMRGPVPHSNSHFGPRNPPTTPDQCVFIRGFRAKRILFWTRPIDAAAEAPPDDPDNHRDDEIQVTEDPGVPKYRDPLVGVLDYIVEKSLEDSVSEDAIAIAHDDDLHLIKDVKPLTADAIEKFLREKKMPLHVENGVRKLHSMPLEASQSPEQPPPPPVVEVRVDRQPELGMGVVPLSARIRAYSPRNEKEVRFMVGQAQMVSLAYANSHTYFHPVTLAIWIAFSSIFAQYMNWWPNNEYGLLSWLRVLPAFFAPVGPIMFYVDWKNRPFVEETAKKVLRRIDLCNIQTHYARSPASGFWLLEFGNRVIGLIAVDASLDAANDEPVTQQAKEQLETSIKTGTSRVATIRHLFADEEYRRVNIEDDLLQFAVESTFNGDQAVKSIRILASPLRPTVLNSLRRNKFAKGDRVETGGIQNWEICWYTMERSQWEAGRKA